MIFIACYSPAIILKNWTETGKKDFKYLGKATSQDLELFYSNDPLQRNIMYKNYYIVPCGNCIGCRLDYSEDWADRALVESFDSPSLFVTITYDDDHEPLNDLGFSSIKKDDVDDFIVSLRNKWRDISVRYLCATEYGDENLRAHAHFILYNIDLDDINPKFYKLNQALSPMYTSQLLSDLWKGRGFVVVEEANYYNMAYTARYILKKQKGIGASEYDAFDITPPSFRMSRKPGIAYDWIINNGEELFTKGYVSISRDLKKSGKITPNRYFSKVIESVEPDLIKRFKLHSRNKTRELLHDKLNCSSFTLEKVNEYNDFARESFLKKSSFNRSNFT